MRSAGFVLVGGASRRMGRDKAALPFRGITLAEVLAAEVRAAAGSVTLVGAPERYESLGIPSLADVRPGEGPLAGIEAALRAGDADWNLIVACDLPRITRAVLRALLEAAFESGADAVVPVHADGKLEPLCAVYHRRVLAEVTRALDAGNRKVLDMVGSLHLLRWPWAEPGVFRNVNTPEEWTGGQLG